MEAIGYGTAGGLCGVNCRHTFAPYFEGMELPTIPETMNGLTSEEHYAATQKQRGLEREVNKLKQQVALGNKAGLPMTEARLRLGHKQRQLKAHCDHYQLPRNYLRERAWGVEKQPRRLMVRPMSDTETVRSARKKFMRERPYQANRRYRRI